MFLLGSVFVLYQSRNRRHHNTPLDGPNVPSNFMIDVTHAKDLIDENHVKGRFGEHSCAPGIRYSFNSFPANGPCLDSFVADDEKGICIFSRPSKGLFSRNFVISNFINDVMSNLQPSLKATDNQVNIKTVTDGIRSTFFAMEKGIAHEAMKFSQPLLDNYVKEQLNQVNNGQLDLASELAYKYKKGSREKQPDANPFYRANLRPFQHEYPSFKAFFSLKKQHESVTSGASVAALIGTPVGLATAVLGGIEAYAYTVDDSLVKDKDLDQPLKTTGLRDIPPELSGIFIGGKHYFDNPNEISKLLEQKNVTQKMVDSAIAPDLLRKGGLWGFAKYSRMLGTFQAKGWSDPVRGPFISSEPDIGIIPLKIEENDGQKSNAISSKKQTLNFILFASPEIFKLISPGEAGAIIKDAIDTAERNRALNNENETSSNPLESFKKWKKGYIETDPANCLLRVAIARIASRDSKYSPLWGDCQPYGRLQSKFNRATMERGFHGVDPGAVDELIARVNNARRCAPIFPSEETTALQHLLHDDLTVLVIEIPKDNTLKRLSFPDKSVSENGGTEPSQSKKNHPELIAA